MDLTDQQLSGLPRRPRVLPGLVVLRRGEHEVQIGMDTRHGIVAEGLSAPLVALLSALNGERTVAELLALHAPDEAARAVQLLTQLTAAGLLDDASPEDGLGVGAPARLSADATVWALRTGEPRGRMAAARERAAVVVRGDGRIAVAVAVLLAASGVGWVRVVAEGQVLAEDTGTGYLDSDIGRPRQIAAVDAVHRAISGVCTDRLPPTRRPDLVVLTDLVVPPPQVIGPLVAENTPHLVIRMREGTGAVGPLVLPGRTCCLHCVDLQRADLDPTWPSVAVQVAGRTMPADLPGAQMTAGFGTAQALLALDWLLTGVGGPALWNRTTEVDPVRATLSHRAWAPHHDCYCGAAKSEEATV
ncbi:ThiF family adenylyltransferase [Kutzneria viridogrisea]|uniref:ThiF family protein n=1 Tax=Kutzneria viridogrisea TaxID=47990 RepID=A0ABR6BTC7_9PSEU|nr:hypothetical protein [Kutzneria viridogrisea]